jgi:hypothetical protein
MRDQRQLSNPHAFWLDNDDAAIDEILLDRREVGEQHLGLLLRPPLCSVPKQNDGGRSLSAEGEQRPEVRVCGDDHSPLLLRALEDHLVARRLQPVVPYMHRVVSGTAESLGDQRRERVVDEVPHAEAASGSSRSRTASAA